MIQIIQYDSPIGWLEIGCSTTHLLSLRVLAQPPVEPQHAAAESLGEVVVAQLDAYFAGTLTRFSLPVRLVGTPFQQRVWEELLSIPYGETISYRQLAERVGSPKACRAVGSANGKNAVCLVVPCHRVVRGDGAVGGYAYGVEVKRWLLALESG